MKEEEFKSAAKYLVSKYVKDSLVAGDIVNKIESFGSSGAKGILNDICENAKDIDDVDGVLIKNIVFYFS